MIFLQTIDPAQKTEEVAKQLASGNSEYLSELARKGVDLAIEGGKSILIAVVIFFVGKLLISFVNRMVDHMMQRRKIEPTIQTFLKSLLNVLMMILLGITVISALGVNTTSFAALLASAGVAVGMALSGNLQNLAGGIVILLFRPYKVGDYIEALGTGGVVNAIQIFHTIILTVDNKKVYLPNGAMSSGNITNFSSEETRRVDFTVGVEYGEDSERVRRVLLELFAAEERILQEPAPVVFLKELAASSVNFTARVWVRTPDYWDVFFEMSERIYCEFNKRGIGFPFQTITLKSK
ncbi:MAG: mechanosensitive ion channel [Prevotella sp.]|jgi:small conductance mechanosensitive channel|nr:mechanosensitive ion channel [Prevotella sp.]MBR0183330.1 mechanosensitive ion channel [Bacteroidaceae bacterium]